MFLCVNLVQAARTESDCMRPQQCKLPDHERGLLGVYPLNHARPGGPRSTVEMCADRPSAARLRSEHSKNHEPPTRPLSGELLEVLTAQAERNREWSQRHGAIGKCFFHDEAGRRLSTLQRHWKEAARTAAPPALPLHDLRRSFVINADQKGVPRAVAMKLTGHRSESVDRRYRIVRDADVRDAVALLDGTARIGY